MQMHAKAVVFRGDGAAVRVETIAVEPPGPNEVMLKIAACDYAFECVGHGDIVAQAYGCLRKGGTAVVVGVAPPSNTTSLRTASLVFEEKTLKGSYYGSTRPRYDFPRLVALYQAGRRKLDELITRRYRIDEAPQAFDDLAQGRNARGVIVFD